MTLVLESPGNLLARPWKVVEFARHWCSFRFQINMLMQTKIAIIVSIRYVFRAAGMPKMLLQPRFLPGPRWHSLQHSPRLLSCCLLLYLNIAGLRQGPGKMLLGAWKVLEFCSQEWEPCTIYALISQGTVVVKGTYWWTLGPWFIWLSGGRLTLNRLRTPRPRRSVVLSDLCVWVIEFFINWHLSQLRIQLLQVACQLICLYYTLQSFVSLTALPAGYKLVFFLCWYLVLVLDSRHNKGWCPL